VLKKSTRKNPERNSRWRTLKEKKRQKMEKMSGRERRCEGKHENENNSSKLSFSR
jgi:hypothetical protein